MATLPAENTAEGGASGTTVSVANSGGTSGAAFDSVNIDSGATLVFDNAYSAHASLGYKFVGSGSGGGQLQWASTQTTVYGRAYILAGSFPAGTTAIIDARNGGGSAASVKLDAAHKLVLYDSPGVIRATGSTVLSATTWYRIEFQMVFNTSAGSITAVLYVGDSTSPTETLTASSINTNSQMTLLNFGWRSYTSDALWMDDLNLNITGYPGPPSTVTTPSAVGVAAGVAQPQIPTPLPRTVFVLRQAAQRAASW